MFFPILRELVFVENGFDLAFGYAGLAIDAVHPGG